MSSQKKQSEPKTWGIFAEFDSPATIFRAAARVRDAGYRKWDVYSPFPIHDMNEAMGLGPSRISWIVGTCAALGASGGFFLQWWASSVAFRLVVHNKPFDAWEQFIPITFEMSILLAGTSAVIGMLILNGLPRWHHPLMSKERFLRVSDDGFFIAIEAKDEKFDPEVTRRLLQEAGGENIELVEA